MSIKSEIIRIGATILNLKRKMAKDFYNPPRNLGVFDKEKFNKNLNIEEFKVDGFNVMTFKNNSPLNKHVIFLHGGAYILEGTDGHRNIIEEFAIKYKLKVSFIDYPLGPEYKADKNLDVVVKAYKTIVDKNKDDEFYLFGDSAGGGLAVTLLQILRDNNYDMRPTKSFLASPWVDISMTNVDIKNFEKKDPFLDVEAVKYAAKQYVGNIDLKDPLVSPLYGEMKDLGSIYILVGTHEIFNPDIYLLNEKMKKAEGTDVKLYLGNKMFHDWIVMGNFKESKDALSKAGDFYLSY